MTDPAAQPREEPATESRHVCIDCMTEWTEAAALATERRLTVERIRERAMALPCYRPLCDCDHKPIQRDALRRILDEEANR